MAHTAFSRLRGHVLLPGLGRHPWRLAGLIALLYLAVPALGLGVFWKHLDQAKEETFANLRTVAAFKASEIEGWLRSRTADAEELTTRTVLAELVQKMVRTGDREAESRVVERLQVLTTVKGFDAAYLLAPDGRLLIAFGQSRAVTAPRQSDLIAQAVRTGRVARSRLYLGDDRRARMDFAAPMRLRASPETAVVCVVLLQVDADGELFPMVARWPTRSSSADTILAERDGNEVVFLHPRLQPGDIPAFRRFPLDQPDLPAAMFARNPQRSAAEGTDYRGVPVLAAQAPVNGSDWQMLVKIDRAEVVGPLVELSIALALQAAAAVTVVSVMLIILWRTEKRSHALDLRVQSAEKDRFLARFFDMPFLGVALANRDRTLIRVNTRLCEILGCTKEDLLTSSWMDWTHPEDREKSRAAYMRMAAGPENHLALEKRYVRRDGEIVAAQVDIQVVRDETGSVDYFLVLVEDVSASQRTETALRETEARYQALMDNSADGIVIADRAGRILEMNHTGERILGYTKDAIRSMSLHDLFPPEHRGLHEAALRECLTTGQKEVRNAIVLRADGRRLPVDIRSTAMELAGSPVVQGVFNDISDRKRLERERRAAEEAHRSALIREVHHRIENNLQGVAGILRRLARNQPTLAEPITDAISRLQGIAVVHGIQGPAAAGVALCELAKRIAENTEALWQVPVRATIECDHRDCILAENEAVPMALVINELLSNAAKHGEEGAPIEIAMRFDAEQAVGQVTVRNRGWLPEGFAPAMQIGFGDGLQLVFALLPRSGAAVQWVQDGDHVVATLTVTRPVFVERPRENVHETIH